MATENHDGDIAQNPAQNPDNEIKRVNENSDDLLKKICCNKTYDVTSWVVLTVLSFITLQYVPHKKPENKKWPLVLYFLYAVIGTTLLGLLINTYPTVVTLLDWSRCPIQYFNVCYLMVLHTPSSDRSELPDIIMRDTSDTNSISDPTTADELERFSDYGKLVFLFSTASGAISYAVLLFCVLWRRYIWKYLKNRTGEQQPLLENEPDPLHPFDDTDDTSTRLERSEGIRFLIFLIINIALVVGMAAVFLSGLYLHHSNPVTIDNNSTKDWTGIYDKVQISVIIVYFYSLLCTISSCFIFSKVMYGIQNKCDNLFTSDDNTTIRERIEEDQKFVKLAIGTQSPFEWWFFIHWVMYIITAFLSLSFLFDAISEKIQGSLPH
ncbi:PREDICTED: uncharacterized protein LOC109590420 isoform X1 [Amphimedon queenslandica]|uniref:Uncharacterized protein n=1 Tax=Amphimedon queenslandica TaxID=400682 RepID=A0AAN0JYA2_AMPQE|nr:PREDICTED: uncharacterized protein LOC109590420 isoform X1 [Amphimedon queenslandica]|eukprot:XP_019861902.1 PREDICTED: uncharacterized protein LOC109590420 isoform X1 [Amphimedon queenslandica]